MTYCVEKLFLFKGLWYHYARKKVIEQIKLKQAFLMFKYLVEMLRHFIIKNNVSYFSGF
jgi:hypothetical protein